MSKMQMQIAKDLLRHNLTTYDDWIVLNNTMQTLAYWAFHDIELKTWLAPRLVVLATD